MSAISFQPARHLLTLERVRAEIDPADRAASLVTVPRDVVIQDRDAELIRRVERSWRDT